MISLNASSTTGSQASTRSTYRIRDNHTILQQPRELDEAREKRRLIFKAINETSAENNSIIKETSNFLKILDLEPKSLSSTTSDVLEKTCRIVRTENLKSADTTALTVSRLQSKRLNLEKSRIDRALKKKYEDLCEDYAKLEAKVNNAQEKVNFISDFVESGRDEIETEYSDMVHKATKLNEYREAARNLENELDELDINDDFPDRILEKYKKYLGATGELAELNKIIGQYGDLPTEILQARAVVEQKEKRRIEVKNLLDQRMIQ
uniref:Uncharacterized protein n=1 Tax=Bracon brevicornis TaxID=1563983 RepID=A0A6V7K5D7_9HYME